ncbi:MAG TPA: pyruvate formate lyase family protein, partial [Promineifilum sp.]|nr:pyruvate formate lyase family protein [Promineifilum sp.]
VRMLEKARHENRPEASIAAKNDPEAPQKILAQLRANEAANGKPAKDPGVKYLKDAYLPELSIRDFPRLKEFLDIHFNVKPAVCHERPKLLTDWYRTNGFEVDQQGELWSPELRQAQAFNYLMANRQPIIRKNDLLAGTTTTKEIGVVLYPDSHAAMLWGELLTVPYRALNPYDIDEDTIRILHEEVFPFWVHRNFRQWVREEYGNPLCQQLDDRFAVYFLWKTVALSHTIIDYPKLLARGTNGIMAEIDERLAAVPAADTETRTTLQAMKLTLEGVNAYAANLAKQAAEEARRETNPARKQELSDLAQALANAPANPCKTLLEAVNSVWVLWVAVHMENTNAGFSMGRLDQWLQPYFEADMARLSTEAEREAYIKYAVELVGCLFMRGTDHLPMVPDIGNYLFGGSSSDQAITLGGVTPEGEDAVNDLTYIFLKVTEMLAIRDPNVNARYHAGKNSTTYLKRLCEVNLNTTATPSIHNDIAVMESLQEFNYPLEHLRDWSATGCVEPTLSGKHMGYTNSMMFNMVAALEMALNNGEHPLMQWKVGPETGDIQQGAFPTFDSFFAAFCRQFQFLADNACEYNNLLGEAHQVLRPTPFLS